MAGKETVQVSTFNKWPFKDDFVILEKSNDEQILKLQCKICAEHLGEIRQEAKRRKIKGSVLSGIVNYVDGVEYIHKTNISRHIKSGGLHDWAKKKFQPAGQSPTEQYEEECERPKKTPHIDVLITANTRVYYTHYFNTALSLVLEERPFNDFHGLIELQRRNGVTFLTGKDDNIRCREFVSFLAMGMREDIKAMLNRANFFSGMMDGSQARKTGAEKELVYCKIVVNGCPTELMLKCQHMPDFGGEDADSVKQSFEEAFVKSFGLPRDVYLNRMVSICTDGASVNMGKYNGACTQMKNDRDWLLVIHCANHRLELAMKDAFVTDGSFKDIDETMTQIYYIFRNSGKAKRIISSLAKDVLGVTFVNFVRASGTRFQNHKYRAIKSMIVNFLPLCLYMENIVENPRASRTENVSKMRGYLHRFLSYKYLASLHFYRQVLQQTAHLSYILQDPSVLITDVIDEISQTTQKLDEIAELPHDLPFPSKEEEDGTVTITASATNLPASVSSKGIRDLTEKQKEQIKRFTHVTRQEYTLKNVPAGKNAVSNIKHKLIPAIQSNINERFSPFLSQEEIYKSIQVIDHTCWDYDDKEFGINHIKKLSQHFAVPLSQHHYNADSACYEFRNLKQLVGNRYRNQKNKINVWRQIFSHYADRFPHILLLVDLCLCISVSSSTVERGFSAAGRVLVDSRLSVRKQTLDDLLLIRINITNLKKLDPNYEDKLVQKAIDMYLSSSDRQRYHRTKTSASVQAGPSKMDEGSTQATEDTFLPIAFKLPENPLLADDPFPIEISESEGDSSEDDDVDRSDEETEEITQE